MSFANFDYEAQKTIPSKSQSRNDDEVTAGNHDLATIISKTSTQLQLFSQLITQLDNQRKQLGTRRDCIPLRETIEISIDKIGEMQRAILTLIAELSQLVNKSSTQRDNTLHVTNRQMVIKERLVGEFNELDRKFRKSIRLYNDKKRTTPIRLNKPVNEQTPLLDKDQSNEEQQRQQQQLEQEQIEAINETELQYHVMLTQERNREIEQVAQGIMEVNSIFKDLNQLVQEQGLQLSTIEDNVLQLHGNTQQAERELHKAHEYQRAKGKWSCILLVALCIVVLVIVLAVVS